MNIWIEYNESKGQKFQVHIGNVIGQIARTICHRRDVVNNIYLRIRFNGVTSDKDLSMKLPDILDEKFVNNNSHCRY